MPLINEDWLIDWLIKLGIRMFHDESWKSIYFGVKRSKVTVTRHKNIAGVGHCTLGRFQIRFCFSCWQRTATTAQRRDHHSQWSRASPRCHHLIWPQHSQARFKYKFSVLLLASSDSKDSSFAWHWVCKGIGPRLRLIPSWLLQCRAGRVVKSHHWSSSACAKCSSSGRQWNSQVRP